MSNDFLFQGECKFWDENDIINMHVYVIDNEILHDFLKDEPITEELKFEITLRYGNLWLP